MSSLPGSVTIVEVGPRDGLQSQGAVLDASQKIRLVDLLSGTGLPYIEAGAFVSPKWVPQMADSEEVFHGIQRAPNVRYTALVPNEKGFERALECGADEIAVFTAASETFNQNNINASIAESIQRFIPVAKLAQSYNIRVRGYISTCFSCPYEGPIRPQAVLDTAKQLEDIGVAEHSIGDTIGMATPRGIEKVFSRLLGHFPSESLALHAHDTRGTALANCLQALKMGISIFDTSVGGVGGCPYAPGATGNLATEDLVFMLEDMNVSTGVSLSGLVEASTYLETLVGPLPSRAYQAVRKSQGREL